MQTVITAEQGPSQRKIFYHEKEENNGKNSVNNVLPAKLKCNAHTLPKLSNNCHRHFQPCVLPLEKSLSILLSNINFNFETLQ